MVKYHVNPQTGEPGACRAKKRCPFGGEDAHHLTKDAARKSYEEGKSSFTSPAETVLVVETIDSLPRMKSREEWEVYSEEDSSFQCTDCGKPFPNAVAGGIISSFSVRCSHCGEGQSIHHMQVAIRDEFADIEHDTQNVKKRRWVHGTTVGPDWFEKINKSGVSLHMGAPEAALDRMLTDHANLLPHQTEKLYFFELEFKEDSPPVQEEISHDLGGQYVEDADSPALVYTNSWEGPGTISIEVHPSQVRVVGVVEKDAKEYSDVKSLYNMPPDLVRSQVQPRVA